MKRGSQIVPLCSFDLSDPEQVAKACHYTNLRPRWWHENVGDTGISTKKLFMHFLDDRAGIVLSGVIGDVRDKPPVAENDVLGVFRKELFHAFHIDKICDGK